MLFQEIMFPAFNSQEVKRLTGSLVSKLIFQFLG